MTGISVMTIAAGRDAHLHNLLAGLAAQSRPPDECIIAFMQRTPYDLGSLPDLPFPVHQIRVDAPEPDALPLARARNRAALTAAGDRLVFLDVDCIPHPELIADYARALDGFDGLLMGEVLYLPKGAAEPGWSYDALDAVAERHSDRQPPPARAIAPCTDYRCFWSLNFALPRALFDRSGGFDEAYSGYGGEDTDFGKSLSEKGESIAWARGARAYHQYHLHHMPPVHHLDSVVRNAQVFAGKWGYRTMGHWLHAFEMMGLIEVGPESVRILRRPDAHDRALTGQHAEMPYVNTARVIRKLKADLERADLERAGLAAE